MSKLRHGTPEEANMSEEGLELVRAQCQRWTTDGLTPALIVLVARHGMVVLHEAWGDLNPTERRPVTIDSIFQIASISKILTAATLMRLVETGEVGLHRPVSQYLPEFQGPYKDRVTVSHLLTHTSGLADDDIAAVRDSFKDFTSLPPCPQNQHEFMHDAVFFACRTPLRHLPGERVVYCSSGFDLVGEVIRRLSGQSFNDYTRKELFLPLGMQDTYFSSPEAHRSRFVDYFPSKDIYFSAPIPHGGAHSTAWDLACFGQMILNEGFYDSQQILSRASVKTMTRNHTQGIPHPIPGDDVGPDSGLGLFFYNEASFIRASLWSHNSFCHEGGSGSLLWIDPENAIVGVFLGIKQDQHSKTHPSDLFVNAVTACAL